MFCIYILTAKSIIKNGLEMAADNDVKAMLETLFRRAISLDTQAIDELAVDRFCSVLRTNSALIEGATDMIISKIKSNSRTESLKALELLDRCMEKCGVEFRMLAGKFRFLNKLISLVSKKYEGDQTPTEIRCRIMQTLLWWSTAYDIEKVKTAYDMLCKEGHSILCNISPTVHDMNNKSEDIFSVEEREKFKVLINSKNPEDRVKANILIQKKIQQKENEANLLLAQKEEINNAENIVKLLCDIMKNSLNDRNSSPTEAETDLYLMCKAHMQSIRMIIETVENNEELQRDSLEVYYSLREIIEKYDALSASKPTSSTCKSSITVEANDLLKGLKEDSETATDSTETVIDSTVTYSSVEKELHDIFSMPTRTPAKNLLDSTTILESAPVLTASKIFDTENSERDNSPEKPNKLTASTIDDLSEILFKENLTTELRTKHFNREPKKISLTELMKEKHQNATNSSNNFAKTNIIKKVGLVNNLNTLCPSSVKEECEISKENVFTTDNLLLDAITTPNKSQDGISPLLNIVVDKSAGNKKILNKKADKIDEILFDMHIPNVLNTDSRTISVNVFENASLLNKNSAFQSINATDMTKTDATIPLSEITVDMCTLKSIDMKPKIIKDDLSGLRIVLRFTSNMPSPNVSVLVFTTTNQSRERISNYVLDAAVPKPCKVRLLPPTGNSLPGAPPFRPPFENIMQVLLLYNPTNEPVDITCITCYKSGSDPDLIRESAIADKIPYFM